MIGMSVHRMLDHGIEGACEEKLHQLVRRVVAAGRLACMASALVGARKREGTAVLGNLRDQFEKALVDVPELIRAHVAPVHTNQSRRLAKPGQMEQSAEERSVLDLRRVKLRALIRREQFPRGRAARDATRHRQDPGIRS